MSKLDISSHSLHYIDCKCSGDIGCMEGEDSGMIAAALENQTSKFKGSMEVLYLLKA